jgi:hypothetical protein
MILVYAIWCGFCWVLRGGMYGVIHRRLSAAGTPEALKALWPEGLPR